MLDMLNLWGHGFVAVPTVLACDRAGLFQRLEQAPANAAQLADELGANGGCLLAALRLLRTLGWLECDEETGLLSLASRAAPGSIPPGMLQWWDIPLTQYLRTGEPADAARWLRRCGQWQIEDRRWSTMLDGVIVIPLLTTLHELDLLAIAEGGQPGFAARVPQAVGAALESLHVRLDWATRNDDGLALTQRGRFASERALILGTLGAYMPMLRQLETLLTGDPQQVFARDGQGHERHVERTLNVVGSGFQHDKYFGDLDQILSGIFASDEPPRWLCDMGCGDGSLLKRAHQAARAAAGDHRHAGLGLIAADLNEQALDAAAQNLGELPHVTLRGDIGDPAQLQADLRSLDIDPDQILHLRSFLDHDRPLLPPRDLEALKRRAAHPYRGVYIDEAGRSIPPHAVVQSLVEHLRRWARVATKHGLLVLEVHCLPPDVSATHLEQSESLHFDAYHAYSRQHLVEADTFLMAAAEAGLFGSPDHFRKYPKTLPFCRITLNYLQTERFRIRHAAPDDVQAIGELGGAGPSDVGCWSAAIHDRPLDTLLVEREGRVLAAALCRRDAATGERPASTEIAEMVVDAQAEPAVTSRLLVLVDQLAQVRGERFQPPCALEGRPRPPQTDPAELVAEIVGQLMRHSDAEFAADRTFIELGLDSLDHMELATLVAQRTGVDIDSSVLYVHDTPHTLGQWLARRSGKSAGRLRRLFSRKST